MKIGYGLSFAAVLMSGAGLVACKKPSFLDNGSDSAAVAADTLHDSGFEDFTPPEIRRTGAESSLTTATPPEPSAVPVANPPVEPVAAATPAPTKAPKPTAPAKSVESAPEPSDVDDAAVSSPKESGDWTLQVGIDKSEAGANVLVNRLNKQGIRAYTYQVSTAGSGLSGSYWRVRVGYFNSRAEADQFGKVRLKPMGFAPWVARKNSESKD